MKFHQKYFLVELSYILNYGLAPYFRGKLFDLLKQEYGCITPKLTSCFDESINRISTRKELNVYLTYFDDAKSLVKQPYFGSQFMCRATSAEVLDSFKEVHCACL